jgi:hypothetical protein
MLPLFVLCALSAPQAPCLPQSVLPVVDDTKPKLVVVVKDKTCLCSDTCSCGCNDGKGCACSVTPIMAAPQVIAPAETTTYRIGSFPANWAPPVPAPAYVMPAASCTTSR